MVYHGGPMETPVPCVFRDSDEAMAAIAELEAEGATEEVVRGPGHAIVGQDATEDQFRDAAIGMAVGAPVFAGGMLAAAWWTLPAVGALGTGAILVVAHGLLMGLIIGALVGFLLGSSAHAEHEEEVDLDDGEVLVVAHAADRDRARAIMEAHGARCLLLPSPGHR